MALALEFHPEARAEAERRGLGVVFATAVREAGTRAAEAPLTGGPLGTALRRIFVHRFPFALLYAIEEHRVFVVAVAHFRRRPGYWTHRR